MPINCIPFHRQRETIATPRQFNDGFKPIIPNPFKDILPIVDLAPNIPNIQPWLDNPFINIKSPFPNPTPIKEHEIIDIDWENEPIWDSDSSTPFNPQNGDIDDIPFPPNFPDIPPEIDPLTITLRAISFREVNSWTNWGTSRIIETVILYRYQVNNVTYEIKNTFFAFNSPPGEPWGSAVNDFASEANTNSLYQNLLTIINDNPGIDINTSGDKWVINVTHGASPIAPPLPKPNPDTPLPPIKPLPITPPIKRPGRNEPKPFKRPKRKGKPLTTPKPKTVPKPVPNPSEPLPFKEPTKPKPFISPSIRPYTPPNPLTRPKPKRDTPLLPPPSKPSKPDKKRNPNPNPNPFKNPIKYPLPWTIPTPLRDTPHKQPPNNKPQFTPTNKPRFTSPMPVNREPFNECTCPIPPNNTNDEDTMVIRWERITVREGKPVQNPVTRMWSLQYVNKTVTVLGSANGSEAEKTRQEWEHRNLIQEDLVAARNQRNIIVSAALSTKVKVTALLASLPVQLGLAALNVTSQIFVLTHLVRDLGEEIIDLVDLTARWVGLRFTDVDDDGNESQVDLTEAIGNSINSFISGIIGDETYLKLRARIAVTSRIYQAAYSVTDTIRDFTSTSWRMAELTVGNIGKIGNALRRSGQVFEDSYDTLEETFIGSRPNVIQKLSSGLERIEDGLDAASSIASTGISIGAAKQEIADEYDALTEQVETFNSDVVKRETEIKENSGISDDSVKWGEITIDGIDN